MSFNFKVAVAAILNFPLAEFAERYVGANFYFKWFRLTN